MDQLTSFKLNDRPVNFRLSDGIKFILNSDVINFKLNAISLADGSFRLLENSERRLLESGDFRILE